jgi:hypothetical protein
VGIHFRTACEDGMKPGAKVGKFVFRHYLKALDAELGKKGEDQLK